MLCSGIIYPTTATLWGAQNSDQEHTGKCLFGTLLSAPFDNTEGSRMTRQMALSVSLREFPGKRPASSVDHTILCADDRDSSRGKEGATKVLALSPPPGLIAVSPCPPPDGWEPQKTGSFLSQAVSVKYFVPAMRKSN